jgi:hypothetical protein
MRAHACAGAQGEARDAAGAGGGDAAHRSVAGAQRIREVLSRVMGARRHAILSVCCTRVTLLVMVHAAWFLCQRTPGTSAGCQRRASGSF